MAWIISLCGVAACKDGVAVVLYFTALLAWTCLFDLTIGAKVISMKANVTLHATVASATSDAEALEAARVLDATACRFATRARWGYCIGPLVATAGAWWLR